MQDRISKQLPTPEPSNLLKYVKLSQLIYISTRTNKVHGVHFSKTVVIGLFE